MPVDLITSYNMSQGLHIPFLYVNDITNGLFINMFIIVVFMIISFGMYFTQKGFRGEGDFSMSMAVGGFVTLVLTILLRLIPGMVNQYTYYIVVVIAMVATLFFFFNQRDMG